MANEYKLTRSAGVLGLRPVREVEILDTADVITQQFVGVSADENENDVYRTSLVNGRTILTDQVVGQTETWITTRINHPEEGWIWYADSTNKLFVNLDNVVISEPIPGASYGADGVINGTTTAYRYTMIDGLTITVAIPVLES
jgi:hypothetical protein